VSHHYDLSVVIPAFNEEGAIRDTVKDVHETLAKAEVDAEVIVVDDGSTDNTRQEAEASGARVLCKPENMGYGAALKTGIAAGDSDYVAIIDSDGTYPPSNLPEMLELARSADMVVGSRAASMSNVPAIRRPAKFVLNSLANYLAQRNIPDLNSGLRVFNRDALTRFIPLLPSGFSFTTTITLCMLCSEQKVIYTPIEYGKRIGRSKIRPTDFFSFILLVLRAIMLFNPLRFFLPLGALLFLFGLFKLVYDIVIGDLSESAIFGFLAAIMIWSLGLIADMIARLHLRP
jgi:glycosyltransferase involved in cell wall biosynthesis